LQLANHFADGQAISADPVKDLAYHSGLLDDDVVPSLSGTFGSLHVPVAVRRRTQGTQLACARGVEPASAAAFEDLRALVFGNDPLDLQEQRVLRSLDHRLVQKLDLDVATVQLLQE
jgi:hypothetical protein